MCGQAETGVGGLHIRDLCCPCEGGELDRLTLVQVGWVTAHTKTFVRDDPCIGGLVWFLKEVQAARTGTHLYVLPTLKHSHGKRVQSLQVSVSGGDGGGVYFTQPTSPARHAALFSGSVPLSTTERECGRLVAGSVAGFQGHCLPITTAAATGKLRPPEVVGAQTCGGKPAAS